MVTKHINSAATNNAQTIDTPNTKGRSAAVSSVTAFNAGAAPAYVKLYNQRNVPVVGTDVPTMVFAVPVSGTYAVFFHEPVRFASGLQLAIVTGAADTDNTAVTAGQVKASLVYTG